MSVQRMKWKVAMIMAMLFVSSPGIGSAQPFDIFVSIAPQKYFVERIGGQMVNVSIMIPPGASPHVYEPKPAQMRSLSQSSIYFAIGVEFEKTLLPKLTALHPDLQIVHTDADIEKMPMIPHHHHDNGHDHGHDHEHAQNHDHGHDHEHKPEHDHDHDHGHQSEHDHNHDHDHGHAHGSDHEHDHGNTHGHGHDHGHHRHEGPDTHVWLAPELVRIQAGHILAALTELDAAHAPVYEANYAAFMRDLDALNADIQQTLAGHEGAAFMVFHPAWGYFARQYGLEQIPVEIEGKEPRAQDLQQLIQRAVEEEIRIVFVSPQFSTRSAETIAGAINGRTVAIDPLAKNWMENMRSVAREFNEAFR